MPIFHWLLEIHQMKALTCILRNSLKNGWLPQGSTMKHHQTVTFNPSWAQQLYQWNKYCNVFAVASDVWGSKWFFDSIAMCLFRYNCTVNYLVNALSQSLGESLVITCENFPRFSPDFDPSWIQTKPRAFYPVSARAQVLQCRDCRPHSVGNHETPQKSHSNPMVLKNVCVINVKVLC